MPEVAGVVAFRERQKGVQEPLVAVGASELTYKTKTAAYRVSAGAFFQTNRFLIDELINVVTAGCSGDLVLDLYAGVGLFSTALAGDIRHTVSVEMSQISSSDLRYNLPVNGKAVQATTEQYLTGRKDQGRSANGALPTSKPDLIVVDPPRSGLGEAVAPGPSNPGAPPGCSVSCGPATPARRPGAATSARHRRQHR